MSEIKNENEIIRQKIVVTGRVQGVGFRYRAQYAANGCGITGYVKNEWDGSVVMEVQGTVRMINQMLTLINRSEYIVIDCIERENIDVVENEKSFHIR